MRRKTDIEVIKNKILPILEYHGVKKAGLFGSCVRGELKKQSDVDILVQMPDNLSLLGFVGVKLELEEALGRKVDLCIARIEEYTDSIAEDDFYDSAQVQDAVLRRLEIIGEAVKHVPKSLRDKYPDIPWKNISGLRDVLIHAYFGVNLQRAWRRSRWKD